MKFVKKMILQDKKVAVYCKYSKETSSSVSDSLVDCICPGTFYHNLQKWDEKGLKDVEIITSLVMSKL